MLDFSLMAQIMDTISYRDTTLPRVELNGGHYDFIYPVQKDFYDSTTFFPPTDGRFFVQNYGPRFIGNYDNHQGTDIWGYTTNNGVTTRNPIALCMCDGVVEDLQNDVDSIINLTSHGRKIRIQCDSFSQVFNSPIHIAYLHLDTIWANLTLGTRVRKGDTIGNIGETGTTTLEHLHLDYYGVPNQWGNTTARKFLNPMRLFDPHQYPHVIGTLKDVQIEILQDWADSTLIRVHWRHNQHINRFEFTNGGYQNIYDVEESRASKSQFEPSIWWAKDSMNVFPYRTNGYRTALYYFNNSIMPAYFPASPSRDTSAVLYGYTHRPLTVDSVINIYDFMLKEVPSGHRTQDWRVKLSDVWGYTVEGSFSTLLSMSEATTSKRSTVKIFPNPTASHVQIEITHHTKQFNSIRLIDLFGNTLLSQKSSEHFFNMDLSSLPSGAYVLTVNDESIRLIKN
jgi:hypothetical protein